MGTRIGLWSLPLMAALVASAGCAQGHGNAAAPSRSTDAQAAVSQTASPRPATQAPVTARLTLDSTTATRAATITGTLTIVNLTGSVLTLYADGSTSPRCRPFWTVILTGRAATQEPIHTAVCSTSPLQLQPGTSAFPIQIRTTYSQCAGPSADSGGLSVPTCGPSGSMPALPAGDYQASFYSDATTFPRPAPVSIHIISD